MTWQAVYTTDADPPCYCTAAYVSTDRMRRIVDSIELDANGVIVRADRSIVLVPWWRVAFCEGLNRPKETP